MSVGSAFFYTKDAIDEAVIGSAFSHTRDAPKETTVGSAFFYTKDAIDEAVIGAPFAHTRDAPVLYGIRNNQVQPLGVNTDRLEDSTGAQVGISNVSLISTGLTTIYTVPAGKKLLLLGIVLHAMSANTVTAAPQISVGVNPSTTNIFAAETLFSFDAIGDMYTLWPNANKFIVANSNDVIDLNVNTAATAAVLTATIRIIGILL
jgi:hypothetical protein